MAARSVQRSYIETFNGRGFCKMSWETPNSMQEIGGFFESHSQFKH
jgi:hypothetical protein